MRRIWPFIAGGIVLVIVILAIGYRFGQRSRDAEITELAIKLATSEQTIEISRGVYATQTREIGDLKELIAKVGEENLGLAEQLRRSRAELLTLGTLVVKWKKAYESLLNSTQTEEPPVTPGDPPRKRVDFVGDLGPIHASGHTLTDPPQAYLKLEQTRPLRLTVAVARNPNGTWSTYTTSSEENMEVEVALSGVDTGILSPKWYQRIWVDVGADFIGDPRGSIGLSYKFDRVSVGASCSVLADARGCGLTAGYRLFK